MSDAPVLRLVGFDDLKDWAEQPMLDILIDHIVEGEYGFIPSKAFYGRFTSGKEILRTS